MFYKSKDIHEALQKQKDDVFRDLVQVKKNALKEGTKPNKFNIQDWAPQEVTDESASPLKRKSKNRNLVFQQSEQENDEDEGTRLLQLQKKKEQVDPEELKQK